MAVAFAVVEDGALLDGLLGDGEGDVDEAVGAGLGGLDGELEGVECGAGVAVGDIGDMVEGVVVKACAEVAVAACGVIECLSDDAADMVVVERLELEDAGAGDEGAVDGEVGVFGGGTDEDDGAVLDPGEEGVLLRLVPAVDFVDEEDGALSVFAESPLGLGGDVAEVGDAGHDGVEGDEMGAGGVGDDGGEGGLACAWRAVEDE